MSSGPSGATPARTFVIDQVDLFLSLSAVEISRSESRERHQVYPACMADPVPRRPLAHHTGSHFDVARLACCRIRPA